MHQSLFLNPTEQSHPFRVPQGVFTAGNNGEEKYKERNNSSFIQSFSESNKLVIAERLAILVNGLFIV